MLRQCDDVAALFACDAIEDAAPHARAVGAVRVAVLGQGFLRFFQNRLRLQEIGHAECGHVGRERRGIELVGLRVDRAREQLEFHRCFLLQMVQGMQQRQRILAARQAEQDAVAFADHAEVADGAPGRGEQ